jgi:hypothetical protein
MVPMHLGLIDGPLVPHNLISTQESPVPLLKFQMAPRLKILMPSGSKKGSQIYFSFLSKSYQTNPLQVPQQGPYGERAVYRAFCISLENLIKIPLNKKALRKKRPSAPQKHMPISEPCLTYLSGSPVK